MSSHRMNSSGSGFPQLPLRVSPFSEKLSGLRCYSVAVDRHDCSGSIAGWNRAPSLRSLLSSEQELQRPGFMFSGQRGPGLMKLRPLSPAPFSQRPPAAAVCK